MAVTWDVDITVTDLAENRAQIVYTRTDDTPEAPISGWRHTFKGIVNTDNLAATRAALKAKAWAEWTAARDKAAAIKAKTDVWEAALEADIAAMEAE